MTTAYAIATCLEHDRPKWLRKAFFIGEASFGAILFAYLVFDYRDKPNKKKAIFIYDKCIFLANGPAVQQDMPDTLDLHCVLETAKPSLDLQVAVAEMKTQRALATGMSWFQRLCTSGERKAGGIGAGPNVFAELLAAHLEETGKDNMWRDFVTNGKIEATQAPLVPQIYQAMKRCLPGTCKELAEAGFNCATLGIKGMQGAMP